MEGGAKAGVIRKIIREKKIPFLGLTETKASDFNNQRIRNLWTDDDFQWAAVDAVWETQNKIIFQQHNPSWEAFMIKLIHRGETWVKDWREFVPRPPRE